MNRFKHIIVTVLLVAATALNAVAQQSEYFLHTVTKGQGLYSISRMYGVTENDIIKLNPGSETVIKVGEQLRIPNKQQTATGHFHTIQKGETLYRLSVENRVSVKEICDANPGLSADNFKIGQVIVIPATSDEDPLQSTLEAAGNLAPKQTVKDVETLSQQIPEYKTEHVVERRETIYRICKNYGITQEEFLEANPEYRRAKLRKGATVRIPYSAKELEAFRNAKQKAQERIESISDDALFQMVEVVEQKKDDVINAALILPLSLEDSASVEQKRMVEFYQGMLLALDKLKNEKVSVNLKVIDSKGEETSLKPLFESGELDDIDIIFGPRHASHITTAAQWSTAHQIPLVPLPLNSNVDDVYNNPYIFQLNTPQSYFHQEIYSHFLKQFKKPNVILLDADDYSRNDFIDGLKIVLTDRNIPYTTIMVDTAYQEIMNALVPDKQNIFIINTPNSEPLNTMLPVLQLVTRNKAPEIETHLFGYPQYQYYASDHLDEMYEVDTWFYSWFYTNNMLPEAVEFNAAFRRAFSRQMMVSYPSYASYGYDTGYYFLKGLSIYGKDFENHLETLKTHPVQMGFKFERVNNWGGFINRKVFLVHFSNDYKVEKIDFDR